MELPPGFRFHPTDEEIITHYLTPKAIDASFSARAVGEVDLYKCEPWELPSKGKKMEEEKKWYFFCQRDRKYPTGTRTNRATEAGYWKATGKDREIYKERSRGGLMLVGMRKTLVFYRGRAPRGHKTDWVMHEFRLARSCDPPKDEWVVCRVFDKMKNTGAKRRPTEEQSSYLMSSNAPQAHELAYLMSSNDHARGLQDYLQLHHHHDAISWGNWKMEQVFAGLPWQDTGGAPNTDDDCIELTALAMRFGDYGDPPPPSSCGGGAMGWGNMWK